MKNLTFIRCRLCLSEARLLVLNEPVKKMIKDFLVPQIEHWPEPEHVCTVCVDYLKVFKKFKKKVLKTQEKLRTNVVKQSTSTVQRSRDKPAKTVLIDRCKELPSEGESIVDATVGRLETSQIEPSKSDPSCVLVEIKTEPQELSSCPFCAGVFKFGTTLDTHMRKRHGALKCQSCPYVSRCKRNYVRHIRTHQNLTSRHKVCSICFKVCVDSVELFAHRKAVHASAIRRKTSETSRSRRNRLDEKSMCDMPSSNRLSESHASAIRNTVSESAILAPMLCEISNENEHRNFQSSSPRVCAGLASIKTELKSSFIAYGKALRAEAESSSVACENSNEIQYRNFQSSSPRVGDGLVAERTARKSSSVAYENASTQSFTNDVQLVDDMNEGVSAHKHKLKLDRFKKVCFRNFDCPNGCSKRFVCENIESIVRHLKVNCRLRSNKLSCQFCCERFNSLRKYVDHIIKSPCFVEAKSNCANITSANREHVAAENDTRDGTQHRPTTPGNAAAKKKTLSAPVRVESDSRSRRNKKKKYSDFLKEKRERNKMKKRIKACAQNAPSSASPLPQTSSYCSSTLPSTILRCSLEKVEHSSSCSADVKPDLQTINDSVVAPAKYSTLKAEPDLSNKKVLFCNLCQKAETHKICWICSMCFRSPSLYIDHMRKNH